MSQSTRLFRRTTSLEPDYATVPPPTLESLPPELQQLAFDFLPRKSDLKNLCLTSKTLRDAALPQLYRHVDMDVDRCRLPQLKGFSLADNSGRRFTKVLHFRLSQPIGDKSAMERENHWKVMRTVLQLLPPNALQELKLPEVVDLDYEFLVMLSSKQRKMHKLSLCRLRMAMKRLRTSPDYSPEWLNGIEALKLTDNMQPNDDLDDQLDIVHHCKSLASLNMCINAEGEKIRLERTKSTVPTSDNEVENNPLNLSESMLHKSSRLESLSLNFTTLVFSRQSLLGSVNFQLLTNINLFYCENTNELLEFLSTGFETTQPALKAFSYEGKEIAATVTNQFFRSFSGLERLRLHYTNPPTTEFHFKSLARHVGSLRELGVFLFEHDINGFENGKPVQMADLPVISEMHCLTDLAIGIPMDFVGTPLDGDIVASVTAFATLPKLRFLRILNSGAIFDEMADENEYPSDIEDGDSDNEEAVIKHFREDTFERAGAALIDELAAAIFRLFQAERLKNGITAWPPSICFKKAMSYPLYTPSGLMVYLRPRCYIPVVSSDRFGSSSVETRFMTCEEFHRMEYGEGIISSSSLLSWSI